MVEGFPPVTRPRMLDVARPESLRKFAMLFVGTLKSPKLWNRFGPFPGLVPPMMSYCTLPTGGVVERLIWVFRPDDVMGGVLCAWLYSEKGRSRRSRMNRGTKRYRRGPLSDEFGTLFLMIHPQ